MPRPRKKKEDSESAEDYSDEEAYEDPADAYYLHKACAPGTDRQRSRQREKLMDIQKEEDRLNKMLEEQSED